MDAVAETSRGESHSLSVRERAVCVAACAALVIPCFTTGCALLNTSPTTRDEAPPRNESDEPPQVVQEDSEASDDAGEGGLHGVIQKWVDRVSHAKPAPARESTPAAPATLTADQSSQQVDDAAGPPLTTVPPPAPADGRPPDTPSPPAEPRTSPPPVEPLPPPVPLAVGDTPAVNAPAAAAAAPTTLTDVLERLGPPTDDSFREQLDRRMLWVIAGEYDRARAPLAVVTAEQQELATRFIEAWIAIREGQADDPARAIEAATRELNQLQMALQKLSDLRLPAVKVCSAVYGFGQYDLIEPARFNAGVPNEFVLYCEVSDFVSEEGEDGWHTSKFDLTTTLLNRAGEAVLELKDSDIVDRCRNRRRDCFIPRLVRLPASLAAGNYVAKTTVVDTLGQKVAQARTTFQLVARP